MFADDLKIFLEIRCENDCHLLQSDHDALSAWATSISLDFNISKCHYLIILCPFTEFIIIRNHI